jgi:hypothetical protein
LTKYIQALAIALLGCCYLPMSQPKNDEQERQLSLSVLNRRRRQPEYLILRLEKDHDKAIFLSEKPKFGKLKNYFLKVLRFNQKLSSLIYILLQLH